MENEQRNFAQDYPTDKTQIPPIIPLKPEKVITLQAFLLVRVIVTCVIMGIISFGVAVYGAYKAGGEMAFLFAPIAALEGFVLTLFLNVFPLMILKLFRKNRGQLNHIFANIISFSFFYAIVVAFLTDTRELNDILFMTAIWIIPFWITVLCTEFYAMKYYSLYSPDKDKLISKSKVVLLTAIILPAFYVVYFLTPAYLLNGHLTQEYKSRAVAFSQDIQSLENKLQSCKTSKVNIDQNGSYANKYPEVHFYLSCDNGQGGSVDVEQNGYAERGDSYDSQTIITLPSGHLVNMKNGGLSSKKRFEWKRNDNYYFAVEIWPNYKNEEIVFDMNFANEVVDNIYASFNH